LANSASSRKRVKQTMKRNNHNSQLKTRLRTFIKKTMVAIRDKNKKIASSNFRTLQKIIDQAVSKNLLHQNNAARKKSRLSLKIKQL
jgi:small subunit ribosomal protein S20